MFKVIAFLMLIFPFLSNATVSLIGRFISYKIEFEIVRFSTFVYGEIIFRGFWFKP